MLKSLVLGLVFIFAFFVPIVSGGVASSAKQESDLALAESIFEKLSAKFSHCNIEATETVQTIENTTGKGLFSAQDSLLFVFNRPMYRIDWETDVAGGRHTKTIATYDGQVVSNLSKHLRGDANTVLCYSHAQMQWVDGFRFYKLLGLLSLKDDETVVDWLQNCKKSKEITFETTRDSNAGRLTLSAVWPEGHHTYTLQTGPAIGIENYNVSYGNPAHTWVKMDVTESQVMDGFVIPKKITVVSTVAGTTETTSITIKSIQPLNQVDQAAFTADPPVDGTVVADVDKQEAYRLQGGKKIPLPFFDPITGKIVEGSAK